MDIGNMKLVIPVIVFMFELHNCLLLHFGFHLYMDGYIEFLGDCEEVVGDGFYVVAVSAHGSVWSLFGYMAQHCDAPSLPCFHNTGDELIG